MMSRPLHLVRRLAALRLLGVALAVLVLLVPRHGLARAEGGLTLVICGAAGSTTVELPGDDRPPPLPPACCVAAGPVALPPSPPLLVGAPMAVSASVLLPPAAMAPQPRSLPRHRPRAPPVG